MNRKKVGIGIFLLAATVFLGSMVTLAQQDRWGRWGTTPVDILDTAADKTNEDLGIQENALNSPDYQNGGSYASEYRITNVLDVVRKNISPYLQWAVYIGTAIAIVLLIYNGFLLVTSAVHTKGGTGEVVGRMKNIGIGVAILYGFFFLIKLVIIFINALTK